MNHTNGASLAIRRNSDGTYSVIDTSAGIRLVKAGFPSHAEAERWRDDWHRQHGIIDQTAREK